MRKCVITVLLVGLAVFAASAALASSTYTYNWNGWQYTVSPDTGSEIYSSFYYDSQGRVSSVTRNDGG